MARKINEKLFKFYTFKEALNFAKKINEKSKIEPVIYYSPFMADYFVVLDDSHPYYEKGIPLKEAIITEDPEQLLKQFSFPKRHSNIQIETFKLSKEKFKLGLEEMKNIEIKFKDLLKEITTSAAVTPIESTLPRVKTVRIKKKEERKKPKIIDTIYISEIPTGVVLEQIMPESGPLELTIKLSSEDIAQFSRFPKEFQDWILRKTTLYKEWEESFSDYAGKYLKVFGGKNLEIAKRFKEELGEDADELINLILKYNIKPQTINLDLLKSLKDNLGEDYIAAIEALIAKKDETSEKLIKKLFEIK